MSFCQGGRKWLLWIYKRSCWGGGALSPGEPAIPGPWPLFLGVDWTFGLEHTAFWVWDSGVSEKGRGYATEERTGEPRVQVWNWRMPSCLTFR